MRGLAPDTIQPLFLEKEKPAVTLQVTRPAAGKGAGGGAERREAGVIDVSSSTSDAGDRGGGCFIPLPVSPSPTGRFPIDTLPRGGDNLTAVNVNTLPKIPLMLPVHCIRGNRQTLPAPSGGGGRRPRSAGRRG